MNPVKSRFAIGLAIAILSLSGCATHSDLKAVRQEARDARGVADKALSQANEAVEIATRADARSMETEEMLNRSFKKSMRK